MIALKGPKPGLVRDPNAFVKGVVGEIWTLPEAGLGSFLRSCVVPPLSIGTILLNNGQSVLGFLCEAYAAKDSLDVTSFGGWRNFVKSLDKV